MNARDLDLELNPGARVYMLPCIAGHVGADAAAATLAESPYKLDEITLLVDVGTNAEIVLGNRNRLLAASSPTGLRSRAPKSRPANARHQVQSSASASTRKRLSLASR